MALLTKWEVSDIQAAIATDLGDGRELYMPNISWGFFKTKGMEADLLWLCGQHLEEYEIKRSKEDFKADFKKLEFHSDVRIVKLHYVLPEAMAGEWLRKFCEEKYQTFGRSFDFMFYREYDCSIIRKCQHNNYKVDPKFTTEYYLTDEMIKYINLHDKASMFYRRLYQEEMCELFRLVVIRYWSHEKLRLARRRYEKMDHVANTVGLTIPWWEKEEAERAKAEAKDTKDKTEETNGKEEQVGQGKA